MDFEVQTSLNKARVNSKYFFEFNLDPSVFLKKGSYLEIFNGKSRSLDTNRILYSEVLESTNITNIKRIAIKMLSEKTKDWYALETKLLKEDIITKDHE